MSLNKFNSATAAKSYVYKPDPEQADSFIILKKQEDESYTAIGDYRILDKDESKDVSEKHVDNLVAVLNGQTDLIDLGTGRGERLLYQPFPRRNETDKTRIVFYTLTPEQGVSKENAVLTIAEDFETDRTAGYQTSEQEGTDS